MGVSYNAIIRQMKKELENLDESTSEQQQVIAKMHVIKSLADVVINSYEEVNYEPSDIEEIESKFVSHTQTTKPTMSDAESRMMGIKPKQNQASKSQIDDDGANGDSIFDF